MLRLLMICFLVAVGALARAQSPSAALPSPEVGQLKEKAPDALIQSSEITAEQQKLQERLIGNIRQVTLSGKRSGEGYFSADGTLMVFQSEREADNPFYQIYLMDRELGDIHRISPGYGKTTCAWIHPDNSRVLFASTQFDPMAIQKQKAEIEFRESGKSRRYSWDYDENYELVQYDLKTHRYSRLTSAVGYDAEASYSPDGRFICFASNRRAYEKGQLNEAEQKLFEHDPASAMDIYIMEADGQNVRRLTDTVGYDGGPFFSPDGKQICWRRFSENGAIAEIMLMNVDGSDQRALTRMGAMSWAPFFHPSGKYLVFTTNLHGFNNFELYLVEATGNRTPVRATYRDGFDGLPVFTPDGSSLVWTSNGQSSHSQIYEASWNHAEALKLLDLDEGGQPRTAEAAASSAAAQSSQSTAPDISALDVGRHLDYLCRPELGGRLTGTAGETLATAYVAAYLEHLGLKPAGTDGSFFHQFEFVSDVKLGSANRLSVGDQQYKLDSDWRPLSFSREGAMEPAEVVFAGYGIVAPQAEGQPFYDSYVHLDVENKWVMVLRRMPQNISPERRQYLAGFSHDRYKAMMARERGAKGIIFVSGPTSQFKSQLIALRMDGSLGASSLGVISITDQVAQGWLKSADMDLAELQRQLDSGEMMMGQSLGELRLTASVDIDPVVSRGRNVLALLPQNSQRSGTSSVNQQIGSMAQSQMIVVGAHIDHLGSGTGSSLAKESEQGQMHRGADDNASGVSCMLEMAQYLADQQRQGKLTSKRDILFAAWSGEELGLRGSAAFTEDFFTKLYPYRKLLAEKAEHPQQATQAEGKLYPQVAGYLNMDMVGRLRDSLILQGLGSSPGWAQIIEARNAVVRLPLTLQQDCHLPTDATSFFLKGVPILAAFTGSHDEYHTPRDVPELINFEGVSKVARLMSLIARDLVMTDEVLTYQEQAAAPEMRANLTASLGTVPDYGQTDIPGVKLSGVTKGAPAEAAGLRGGDIIVELAGRKIENIYDYTYAIEALKIGERVKIKARRGQDTVEVDIIPSSRN